MFEYTICDQPDDDVFAKQRRAIESKIPNLVKERVIHDVDNSRVQKYRLGESTIKVHNDYTVGAVYVNSDIDLTQFFR